MTSPGQRLARLLAVAVCLAVSGCGAAASPTASPHSSDYNNICQGSVPGGQVVLYSATGLEYWYADVLSAFQAECDVAIFYAGIPSGQIAPRVEDEKSAPLADIVIATAPEMTTMADEDLLDGTDVPNASSVPTDRCDSKRRWCAVIEDYTSWGYDPKALSPPLPDLSGLLAQRFRGHLLTSRPSESIDGLGFLAELWTLYGTDGAVRYLTALERNVSAHYVSTDTMSRLDATAVAVASNGALHEQLNDIDQYHNLKLWFPSTTAGQSVTLSVPFGAALVHGGQNRDNARALLSYMWSKEGQGFVGLVYGAPARPDVVPDDVRSKIVRATLVGVQILRIDWEAFAKVEAGLIARLKTIQTVPEGTAPPSVIPTPALPTLAPSVSPTPT